MKRTKSLSTLFLVLLLVLALTLTACSQPAEAPAPEPVSEPASQVEETSVEEAPAVEATESQDTPQADDSEAESAIPGDINGDGKVIVGYNNMYDTEEFFRIVKQGMQDACDARGWEMISAFAERDPERMVSNVNSFLVQNADFVIDFNVVPETGSALAKDLGAKGIPMLTIDCVYEDAYFFGVNNQQAGEVAGEYLVERINEEWDGELDYIFHCYVESAGPDVKMRNSGAGDAIRAAFPDFDPENEIWQGASPSDFTDAKNLITNFLTAHPDSHRIAVVMSQDNRAVAALGGIEASGRMDDIMMVSHNADETAIDHLKSTPTDAWRATLSYNSPDYGENIAKVMERIFAGEDVDQMNYNTLTIVNRDNVNEVFPD